MTTFDCQVGMILYHSKMRADTAGKKRALEKKRIIQIYDYLNLHFQPLSSHLHLPFLMFSLLRILSTWFPQARYGVLLTIKSDNSKVTCLRNDRVAH